MTFCMQARCWLFLSKLKYSHTGSENLSLSITSCPGLLIVFLQLKSCSPVVLARSAEQTMRESIDPPTAHSLWAAWAEVAPDKRADREEKCYLAAAIFWSAGTPDRRSVLSSSYHGWALHMRVHEAGFLCLWWLIHILFIESCWKSGCCFCPGGGKKGWGTTIL